MSVWEASTAPGSNASGITSVNWAEGQDPSTVNDSQRQWLAYVAEYLLDTSCSVTTAGTASAMTLSTNGTIPSLRDGLFLGFIAHADANAGATMDVDGQGAKALLASDATAIKAGDIVSGGAYLMIYDESADSASGGWIVLNARPADVPSFTISGTSPVLTLTDTDTGADCEITADSTTGSISIRADDNNEVADSVVSFHVDGTFRARINTDASLLLQGPLPRVEFTDSDTNADSEVSANSTSGSLLISADKNGEIASSAIFCDVDGTRSLEITASAVVTHQYIRPDTDNALDLGSGSFRFDDVYATNGTIQTSDGTEKDLRASQSLTADELAAWGDASQKVYQWKAARAAKGEDARYHVGVIAQELEAAFTARGLDPYQHGVLVKMTLEDGSTRLGIRPGEAMWWESAYLRSRIASLEARIAALESA